MAEMAVTIMQLGCPLNWAEQDMEILHNNA